MASPENGRTSRSPAAPSAQDPAAQDRLLLDQEFDADSLYALRAAVAAHAAAAGLNRNQVHDVVAAAHELAANAVLHGAGHGRLHLRASNRFLDCQVSDDGPAGDGVTASGAAPWSAEHGHGLWLVSQVADQYSLDHGTHGTTATATFALPSPGQQAGAELPATGGS
jgi:anti-sigma regulatory factor (Ser/Thr protein kinase)